MSTGKNCDIVTFLLAILVKLVKLLKTENYGVEANAF